MGFFLNQDNSKVWWDIKVRNFYLVQNLLLGNVIESSVTIKIETKFKSLPSGY